ncbi:MAG: hypothetical protein KDD60_05620 [Bdellovibrionales bacterium]|nr:hypothetical protein [Bdellovibrionales bacterium]
MSETYSVKREPSRSPLVLLGYFLFLGYLIGGFSFDVSSASAQELEFKPLSRRRNLVLRDCPIINGIDSLTIVKRGNKVLLPRKTNRKGKKLGARYTYFACGPNESSGYSLYAKATVDSEVVEFALTEKDFKEKPKSAGRLSSVCKSIRELSGADIYKTRGSDHFSDCRRNTFGLVVAPGGQSIGDSCLTVFDSDGNELASMGAYYPAGPPWRYRAYNCWGCSKSSMSGGSLAAAARKKTGSSTVYLQNGTQCIRVPDAGRCYNSSSC